MTSKNSLRSWHRVVDFKEIFYVEGMYEKIIIFRDVCRDPTYEFFGSGAKIDAIPEAGS